MKPATTDSQKKRPEIPLNRVDAVLGGRPEFHLPVHYQKKTEHQKGLGGVGSEKGRQLADKRNGPQD